MKEYPYHHEPGQLPPSLASIPFLTGFDETGVNQILDNTSIVECDRGDTLIREGESPEFLYILLRGQVGVYKGHEKITSLNASGELIGELGLLNNEARSASVIADSPAYCLKIDSGFMNSISDAERSGFYAIIYRFLAELLADRLATTSAKLAELEKLISAPPSSDRYQL